MLNFFKRMHKVQIMKTKTILLLLLILMPLFMGAKKDPCIGFHECMFCHPPNSKGFQEHGLSKSALLEIGVPSILEIDLYGGKDFIVTACTNRSYYPVRMRIMDDKQEVLYDNQMDNYKESIGFTLEQTTRISIELTLLAESISQEDFDDNRSCAGLNILWRKTPRLGF